MLVLDLGLGLKAKFCGLGLRGLALAKNSRPKSWRTTMFTMNFLTSIDSSELYFNIHVPYLLNVPTLVTLLIYVMSVMSDVIKLCLYPCKSTLEKTGFHYFIFHRKPLHWDGHGHGLGLGLGLECSGLVNITGNG